MRRTWWAQIVVVAIGAELALGCGRLELDSTNPALIHARFDPDEGVIPMPNDALRDAARGRLDVPIDDEDLTASERELFTFMDTRDGWSTTQPITVEFTGEVRESSFHNDAIEVWQWGPTPTRLWDVRVEFSNDLRTITINAPRAGWDRSRTYVAMLRGGESGPRGMDGEIILADAAFYFLRLETPLDDPAHQRAFPGETRYERRENAIDLEELRLELVPYFDFFESQGIARADVAALWHFTVTDSVELAMDEPSQRMPLPFNLLLDPDTGLVELPIAEWDSETEMEAKRRLSGHFDGFGLSARLMFEATGPLDPATVNDQNIELVELAPTPIEVPISVELMEEKYVLIEPRDGLLRERTEYAIIVREGLRAADGSAIAPMVVGQLMRSESPVHDGSVSQIEMIDDEDAERVEWVRSQIAPFLDRYGREGVVTAWPFRTQTVWQNLQTDLRRAESTSTSTEPVIIDRESSLEALTDFALAVGTVGLQVDEVIRGTIESPVYLDPATRGFRESGDYEVEDLAFTMTIPENAANPMPVVVYAHAIMTERRFVLSVGDALAREGFAAIAIDLPYHGLRTVCFDHGPASIPDPDGEIVSLPQCPLGAHCGDGGHCVNAAGREVDFNRWPVLNYPIASGSAFVDVDNISNTRDHFRQSIIDFGALVRVLREGDWDRAIGHAVDVDRIHFVGMSLGGIIGSTFVAITPEIDRAVLNVPGADLVDLFDTSGWFGQHIDAFFLREGIELGGFERERFLNVARWFIDSVDPHSVAHAYRSDRREALIQMATLDFIIPNLKTELLQEMSGLPRRDYVAEHGFLAVPIEPAYLPGVRDMAAFLSGDL